MINSQQEEPSNSTRKVEGSSLHPQEHDTFDPYPDEDQGTYSNQADTTPSLSSLSLPEEDEENRDPTPQKRKSLSPQQSFTAASLPLF